MNTLDRYARQMQVAGFDVDAQHKLAAARVLLVGAGGLGGPIAAQLVGAGVGQLEVVDFDSIALSNLHRQWLYTESDVGAGKAATLDQHLQALNSNVEIQTHSTRVSPKNVAELTQYADLVIDAADNHATTFLLNHACAGSETALLTASVNQRYGYIGLFCAPGAPSLRVVFPRMPKLETSCDTVGVSGPAVVVIAGLQAQIALDYLVGLDEPHLGKMRYVDMRDFNIRTIDCSQMKEPTSAQPDFISADEISMSDWVVDVREQSEIRQQTQSFKVDQVLPSSEFEPAAIVDQGTRIVLACRSGQRAMAVAQQCLDHGYQNLAVVLPSGE